MCSDLLQDERYDIINAKHLIICFIYSQYIYTGLPNVYTYLGSTYYYLDIERIDGLKGIQQIDTFRFHMPLIVSHCNDHNKSYGTEKRGGVQQKFANISQAILVINKLNCYSQWIKLYSCALMF